ncbi:transglycosylase domain-containing protein [Streptomyces bacillaris]|uniref:Penicillin-binding protein n=1 Tax=Streptomyces cavourensis TaxID=67258 RepID=A0ABY5EYZ9_9ACTN|nr:MULTISPECIES: transglycosylase domain-containing protein [Streptomyces]NUW22212.1 penicillin-binding protein [Streptomyces roseoviolaceus]ATY96875.1 penicillin-binding protein [Streptomyces cavourensis]NUV44171.1 penicillin-binding protein [Streptomyces sp. CAI-24]NUV80382.1 penicillin-binding protein [Streptomyces sp. CAI-155]NUV87423.1 penicillin-binding protein [Streptomyces sp. KAI-26]
MSEHRRKSSQPQGGGRAAARRAAQQSTGRRAAPSRRATSESPSESLSGAHGEKRPYGTRAEARRAAQRGGGRRRGGGDAGPPGKKRAIDYPRYGKHGFRRWVPSWKLVSGLCIGFLGLLMGVAGVSYALVSKPSIQDAAKAQNNVYYWANGEQMVATGGVVNRQEISYEQIPEAMRNAVVSAENKSFWSDRGIDPKGIGRAVFNMATGGQTQGGSTITQQYVKNSRLNQDQTFTRKFKELFITLKVAGEEDKRDVMAGYLNVSYYGRGASGLQAAARTYYDKDATDLNPSECAFLATLLKGASYYDPAGAVEIDKNATPEANTKRAKDRWEWILDEQVKDGRMTAAERAKYTEFPMPKPPRKNAKLGGQTGYLVELARKYFLANNTENITAQKMELGGFEIHTTFDKKKVEQLTAAVDKVYKAKIRPEERPKTDTHVEFGGASVDAQTGAILATYGGQDATKHFTNNADATGAQVGSTWKPFVLAAAMQYGARDPNLGPEQNESQRTIVSPESVYNGDNKLRIRNYNGEVWKGKDDQEWLQTNDGQQDYGDIDLRYAMEKSANSPFVQLGMDVGTDKVKDAAVAAGLRDDGMMADSTVPSFSIGTSSPSAIRMAGAYATFATSGQQNPTYSVTEVKQEGRVVFKHKKQSKRAFSPLIADNITDVLKGVVEKGTGTPAQLEGREAAGKTGTTDGNKSAWFVGYTPQISTAISMFRLDDDETNKDRKFEEMFGTGGEAKIHGSSFPATIWHDYMTAAMKGKKAVKFPEAQPIGETVWGGGAASPTPTPSPTPSPSPSSEEPEPPTPSPTPTTPTPTPSKSCDTWDWDCHNNPSGGGANAGADGGANAGADGGANAGANGGADGGANAGADGGANTGTTEGTTEGAANGGNGANGANGANGGNGGWWTGG